MSEEMHIPFLASDNSDRALKGPSDAEPNMLNGMKWEGPPTPANQRDKKICPDTANGSLWLQHNYSIIRKTTYELTGQIYKTAVLSAKRDFLRVFRK